MSKIIFDPKTGCWNWLGCKDKGGYGHIQWKRKDESIHRVFYAWKKEKLPRGKGKNIPQIDHLCKNRSCCNVEHMELVSFKENILRGNSPSANHARKIYCKRGHLLPEEFNYYKPKGQGVRICKICEYELEHSTERKEKQKKARFARENGPRRKELLEKHRQQEASRREKSKQFKHSK